MSISKKRVLALSLWSILFATVIPFGGTAINVTRYIGLYGGGVLLLSMAFPYFKYVGQYARKNPIYRLLEPMLFIWTMGTFVGIINGATFLSSFPLALLPFAGALLILLPVEQAFFGQLLVLFQKQLFVSIILGVIFVIRLSPSYSSLSRTEWYLTPERNMLELLVLVPFFAGSAIGSHVRKTVIITAAGFILYATISLRSLSRGAVIVIFLIIPVTFFLMLLRTKGKIQQIGFWLKSLLLVGLVTLGYFSFSSQDVISTLGLDTAWNATLGRLTGQSTFSSISEAQAGFSRKVQQEIETSRGAEARDFLQSLHWWEFIVGKGFGASWYSQFWGEDWQIVHIGPLFLIQQGGIPLLIVYYAFLLSALKTAWRNSPKDPVARGCFIFLVMWFSSFFKYGAVLWRYSVPVYWLIVGMALSTGQQNAVEPSSGVHAKVSSKNRISASRRRPIRG